MILRAFLTTNLVMRHPLAFLCFALKGSDLAELLRRSSLLQFGPVEGVFAVEHGAPASGLAVTAQPVFTVVERLALVVITLELLSAVDADVSMLLVDRNRHEPVLAFCAFALLGFVLLHPLHFFLRVLLIHGHESSDEPIREYCEGTDGEDLDDVDGEELRLVPQVVVDVDCSLGVRQLPKVQHRADVAECDEEKHAHHCDEQPVAGQRLDHFFLRSRVCALCVQVFPRASRVFSQEFGFFSRNLRSSR